MTNASLFPSAPDVSSEDYCVFGVATCFIREEGEIHQVQVLEPIPSAALEALIKGIPTSYQLACAKLLNEVFIAENPQIPADFPPDTQLCDQFAERTVAAVRTYKSRTEAQIHIPLGTSRRDFNYSLEKKRVLNAVNVVRTEDNVKQHSHTHQVL
jgi:hypothetical protein